MTQQLKTMSFLPKSLFGRLTLVFVAGLLVLQGVTMALHLHERAGLLQLLAQAGVVQASLLAMSPDPGKFALHLSVSVLVVMVVSVVAVRCVTRPLQHLADAVQAFGHDLNAPALVEEGSTETRRAAVAFNTMQRQVKHLVDERSRALEAVSHDLRTPLTRMRLRVELVADLPLQDQLNTDIDAMQAMVNSVLTYLRGLQNDEPVQRIDLRALLRSLVEDRQALGQPVHLREPDNAVPLVVAGRLSTLQRAVGNLVDNAVKYGHEATVACQLIKDSMTDMTQVQITVDDCGPGIAPGDLQRVLQPYVRLETSRSRDTGGVGLGLAVALDAATVHAGTLVLENRPDGGLRARLTLLVQAALSEDF